MRKRDFAHSAAQTRFHYTRTWVCRWRALRHVCKRAYNEKFQKHSAYYWKNSTFKKVTLWRCRVLYGGKDSTYLLYYLSKVLHLRGLALTWIIPFASESALKSIENTRKKLESVEFVTRSANLDDLKKFILSFTHWTKIPALAPRLHTFFFTLR